MSPQKFRDFRETGPRPDTRIEIAQQILGTPIGGKQTSGLATSEELNSEFPRSSPAGGQRGTKTENNGSLGTDKSFAVTTARIRCYINYAICIYFHKLASSHSVIPQTIFPPFDGDH